MPAGGATGQVLSKVDGTSYNVQWITQPGATPTPLQESKAIYVDGTYGSNATGQKYNRRRPYQTYAGALAVMDNGDWIIFNPGTYTLGELNAPTTVNNFWIFCKPGVVFTTGFIISAATQTGSRAGGISLVLFGHAIFYNTIALLVTTGGGLAGHFISMEFDSAIGGDGTILLRDYTARFIELTVSCNSIQSARPFEFRTYNSANPTSGVTYSVTINAKKNITSTGERCIYLDGQSVENASCPIFGTITITSPIIENTSAITSRTVLSISNTILSTSSFRMVINADIMRLTNTSYADAGLNNLAGVIRFDGGDNLIIKSDLDSGPAPCIYSSGFSGVPHYGNMTITGNVYSDREIVQHYSKSSNGNGWHNIIFKNSHIISKGLGTSDSMFHRADNWNSTNGGIPGNVQFINCTIYNQNANGSANATIIKDDLSDVGKNNNFQIYGSMLAVETSGFLATSTQASKSISIHKSTSNRPLGATVTDVLSPSGLTIDADTRIFKYRLW